MNLVERTIVLMFQPRFAELVRDGKKLQTIRPERKRPILVGDRLSLRRWIDKPYRSKQEKLIGGRCVEVSPVAFGKDIPDVDAKADGFRSGAEMAAWFEAAHGLPFQGRLIRWRLLRLCNRCNRELFEIFNEPHCENCGCPEFRFEK